MTLSMLRTERDATHVRLLADGVTLGYEGVEVARDLTVGVPDGEITCIVGANACGKSTLLRAMARLLRPAAGTVLLDGADIHRLPTRMVATRLGLLPQAPSAPAGLRVIDLVARGRHPHRQWLQRWSAADEAAVSEALRLTDTESLADRYVDELSGGQRQRVWIAMALAQDTDVLLLDEPTTYLDIAHQVEVLDLLLDLNDRKSTTIVMVLHDLNQAARYSDHLVALAEGRVVGAGRPDEIITTDLVQRVFGIDCAVMSDPISQTPMVVPISRQNPRTRRERSVEPGLATI